MARETHPPDASTPEWSELHFGQLRDANEALVLSLVREAQRAELAESENAATKARESVLLTDAAFRERLIGIVGHDLRTPLNAMIIALRLLATSGDLTPSSERLAERGLDAGRRMNRIILQVLEFTRARLGGFSLDLARVDLGDVCRRVLSELRLASSRDATLSEVGDVSGTWDAELLCEAMGNIIGNAFEYADPRSKVEIEIGERGADVCVSVTNEGPPVPEELAARIFDPFHRSTTPERRDGHLGLGLYVAHEIIRAHGGRIEVSSASGHTRFTITLPHVAPRIAS